jgi:hypothetical protein
LISTIVGRPLKHSNSTPYIPPVLGLFKLPRYIGETPNPDYRPKRRPSWRPRGTSFSAISHLMGKRDCA